MAIKKIPKDTKTFHYYNANPKNKRACDCVIRAICTALNQPWEQTMREMVELGIKDGYTFDEKHTIEKYLKLKGWTKHKQPRKDNNTKYTGKEFCEEITSYDCKLEENFNMNRIVANIGGHHIVAIIEGQVNDIWNSTGGCIGNFWTMEG